MIKKKQQGYIVQNVLAWKRFKWTNSWNIYNNKTKIFRNSI